MTGVAPELEVLWAVPGLQWLEEKPRVLPSVLVLLGRLHKPRCRPCSPFHGDFLISGANSAGQPASLFCEAKRSRNGLRVTKTEVGCAGKNAVMISFLIGVFKN